MKFHEVTCEKYFRKARQMRSASVADHLLRALVALTAPSPHRRQFVSIAVNWFLSIIGHIAAHAAHRYMGMYLFFYLISVSSDQIFVINGLDKELLSLLRASDRPVPKKISCRFWQRSKIRHRNATVFPYFPSRLLIITRSRHATSADGHFYIRALFASLKFQLDSTNTNWQPPSECTISIGELSSHFSIEVIWKSPTGAHLSSDFLFSYFSFTAGSISALSSTAF